MEAMMTEHSVKETAKPRRARKSVEPEPAVIRPGKLTGVNPPAGFRRPLESGDRGPVIADVQRQLTVIDMYAGKISGVFGYETVRAVRRLQGVNGLKPTGTIDAATWAALYKK
jgi:peptidoglycan hydrolase-like protein with peptidoglycan-binding domain